MTISQQLYSNNAKTTLASAVLISDTTITVANGAAFPSPGAGQYFLITIENVTGPEIIKVTTRTGNVFSGCVRAQEGTTAAAFATGTKVENRLTSGSIAQFARITDRVAEISSVDLLSTPSNSDSNSYICASVDDAGNAITAFKKDANLWRFGTHGVVLASGTVSGAGRTSTHINFTVAIPTLLSVTSGKYIFQITSGAYAGVCRLLTSATTTGCDWLTATSGPISGNFEIYKSTASAFADVNTLASIGTINRFDNNSTLSTTAFVKSSGLHTAGTYVFTDNVVGATNNVVLTATAVCGKTVDSGCVSNLPLCTVFLPLANFAGSADGETILFVNSTNLPYTLTRSSTDLISWATAAGSGTTVTITPGDSLLLQSNGVNKWIPIGGTLALYYGSASINSFRAGPFWITQPLTDNSTRLATTEYVTRKIGNFALVDSQTFIGVPRVPTALPGTTGTQIASLDYVLSGLALKANIASPSLTGIPLSITGTLGDSSKMIATNEFVANGFAPKASPTLTGVPLTPTAPTATSTTQIASTAFVKNAIAFAMPALSPVPGSTTDYNTFRVSPSGLITAFSYVAPSGGGGANLIPLDNVWTGANNFKNGLFAISSATNSAVFNTAGLSALTNYLSVNSGIQSAYSTTLDGALFGFKSGITRTGGASGETVGGDFSAIGAGGAASVIGARATARNTTGVTALTGLEVVLDNISSNTNPKFGVNLVQQSGVNNGVVNSVGLALSAKAAVAGGTVGWKTGIRFLDGSLSKDTTVPATPKGAIGIDFSYLTVNPGIDVTSTNTTAENAYPMVTAINLKEYQSIGWASSAGIEDAPNQIKTFWDKGKDSWRLTNIGGLPSVGEHRFGVVTGNGSPSKPMARGSLLILADAGVYFQTTLSGVLPDGNGVGLTSPKDSSFLNLIGAPGGLKVGTGASYGPNFVSTAGSWGITAPGGVNVDASAGVNINALGGAITFNSSGNINLSPTSGGIVLNKHLKMGSTSGILKSSSAAPSGVANAYLKITIDGDGNIYWIPIYSNAQVSGTIS